MPKKSKVPLTIFLILQCLWVLSWLPGCFRKAERVAFVTGAQLIRELEEDGREGGVGYRSGSVHVTPGVYEIRVREAFPEGSVKLSVESETETFRSLLTNSVTVRAGDGGIRFSFWVTGKDRIHLRCLIQDAEPSAVEAVEIFRTGGGNRLLVTVSLVLFLLLDGLILLKRGILSGEVTKRQQVVIGVMAGAVCLAFFPFFTDYITIGTENLPCLIRMGALAEKLRSGELGAAFSGDFLLLFPTLLLLLGFPAGTAYKWFVFCILAATMLMAYFAFWGMEKEEYAALCGAVVFLLHPWHLALMFRQGNVEKGIGWALLPLLLCILYLPLKRWRKGNAFWKPKGAWPAWGLLWTVALAAVSAVLGYKGISALMCAVSAFLLFRWLSSSKDRRAGAVLALLILLSLWGAVCQVNEIALTMKPVYLYEVKNIGS